MLRCFDVVLAVFSLVGFGVGVASATTYNVTDLGPVGTGTVSNGIAVGLVGSATEEVGWSQAAAANRVPVAWIGGTPTNLLASIPGASAGAGNSANAIDSDGDIVGATVVGGNTVGFYLRSGGPATLLPTLGGTGATIATGVSDSGTVVGYSTATDGNVHAFVWSASTGIIDLGTSGEPSTATALSADGSTIIGDWNGMPARRGSPPVAVLASL